MEEQTNQAINSEDDLSLLLIKKAKQWARWALVCSDPVEKPRSIFSFLPEVVPAPPEPQSIWLTIGEDVSTLVVTFMISLMIFWLLDYFIQFCYSLGIVLSGKDTENVDSTTSSPMTTPRVLSPVASSVAKARHRPMNEPVNCVYKRSRSAPTQSSCSNLSSRWSNSVTEVTQASPTLPPSDSDVISLDAVSPTMGMGIHSVAASPSGVESSGSMATTQSNSQGSVIGPRKAAGREPPIQMTRYQRRPSQSIGNEVLEAPHSPTESQHLAWHPSLLEINHSSMATTAPFDDSMCSEGFRQLGFASRKRKLDEQWLADMHNTTVETEAETSVRSSDDESLSEVTSSSNDSLVHIFSSSAASSDVLLPSVESSNDDVPSQETNDALTTQSDAADVVVYGGAEAKSGKLDLDDFSNVEFQWKEKSSDSKILITGSFLGWKMSLPLEPSDEGCSLRMNLPAGSHDYCFIEEGKE